MKQLLNRLLIHLLLPVLLYFTFALVQLSFDVSNWTFEARAGFGTAAFLILFCTLTFDFVFSHNELPRE